MAQQYQPQGIWNAILFPVQSFLAQQARIDAQLQQQLISGLQSININLQQAEKTMQEVQTMKKDMMVVCQFLNSREMLLHRMIQTTQTQNHP